MTHRREILAIALPAIVANITTPLLGLVDVAVTGHIGAAVYIAAIAVGGTMFNMLYWLFNFLRMGTTGLTAQAYGAARGDTSLILARSVVVAVVVGALLIALSEPLGAVVLRFMDGDASTTLLARRYFRICIWGAPAVMLSYSFSGWFLGMQNSRAQMVMAVVTNVANIAVSVALVFGLGWKIEGVATGTLSAQWIGAGVGAIIIARRYRPTLPPLPKVLRLSELRSFCRTNVDIFLRTVCLVGVTVWFTHAGALSGTDILAANAMLLQLFMLFSYFMDGFAFAGEALAGKYAGGGDMTSVATLSRSLMRIGLGFAVAFSVVYLCAGDLVMKLLASDPGVVDIARRYLPWAALVPLCSFAAFVCDGLAVGLVRTRAMLVSLLVAAAIFFGVWAVSRAAMGNDALWLAFNTYLLARGIILSQILQLRHPNT